MAKVSPFIYCSQVDRPIAPDGSAGPINALGVMSTLILEYIPGTFSFSICFSLIGVDPVESDNAIRLLFRMKDSDRLLVDTGTIVLPSVLASTDVSLPALYAGIDCSIDFRNVIFEQEGLYATEVYYKNELMGEFEIYVAGKHHE